MFRPHKLLPLLLLISTPALAWNNWHVSGFGSIGASRLQSDALDYMDNKGTAWNFESDTVLGLQLNGNLAERLSLTAQAVARGYNWDDTGEFEPQLDWLFLRYQLSQGWRLRLGRLRTPHYLFSETLDVGYSYPWARPPVDVYAPVLAPFSSFDGMDLAYISDWNGTAVDLQLLGGRMKRTRDSLSVKVSPMWGGNLKLQRGELTLRYGLIYDRTDIHDGSFNQAQTLYDNYSSVNPLFGDIADALYANGDWYRYQSLGANWEHQNFTTTAEAFDIRNTDDGYTNNAHGWYLSTQYRFNLLTPYIVYGHHVERFNQDARQDIIDSYGILPAGLPGNEALDTLRQLSLETIDGLSYEQYSWTAGIRYDLLANMALKAEWQRFHFGNGSSGQLIQLTNDPPRHTSMVTIILDAVF